MLTQQLTGDPADMSGLLTISAEPGALAELQGLAKELGLRPTIVTNGSVEIVVEAESPPPA